jgi:hypothetical protein
MCFHPDIPVPNILETKQKHKNNQRDLLVISNFSITLLSGATGSGIEGRLV